jgi:hypothetical protein
VVAGCAAAVVAGLGAAVVAGFGATVVTAGAAVVAALAIVVTGAAVVAGAFGGVPTFDEPHPTNTSMRPAAKAEAVDTDLITMNSMSLRTCFNDGTYDHTAKDRNR